MEDRCAYCGSKKNKLYNIAETQVEQQETTIYVKVCMNCIEEEN